MDINYNNKDKLSNNLSDEPNKSIIYNNDTNFNINSIYKELYKCLSNFKSNKILGEVITVKISDGNAWINIKIDDSQITGVFWQIINEKKYDQLKLIKSGDKVTFFGNFNIMKKNFNIYFNIKSMDKIGKGDYLDLFDKYRIKIKDLNLGMPKKILNIFPYTIGIITALEGAAIQDILQTLKLDKFIGKIIIKNSIVQGSQCSKSIINSIEWFESNYKNLDLLMITRGGGSFEDLIGFSDWDVILKISSCKFITISAVGHQTDSQLSDDVADYKFATPSIGAKFIVETQNKYLCLLENYKSLINNLSNNYLESKNIFNKITINYNNIIKTFDLKNILINIKYYSKIINSIVEKYYDCKNIFYNKLTNLKPSIFRNNEIISINDFVNLEKNKAINPKKIDIIFIDGKVSLSYKILNYELFD